jgi:hypothetical protein
VVISFIFAIWPLITNSFSQGVTSSPLSMLCSINFTSRESATIAYTISYALVVSNSLGATIFVHELLRRKLTKTHITQMASQRVLSTQGVLGTSSQSAPSNEDIARGLDWNILSRKNINQTQVQKDTKKWLQNFYMTVLYTIGWSPAAMYAVYELATGRQASLELYALFVLSVSITSILNSILSLYSDLSP